MLVRSAASSRIFRRMGSILYSLVQLRQSIPAGGVHLQVVLWVADHEHMLVVANNEATAEVKDFLTNATAEPLPQMLAVDFRLWAVEHSFRFGKYCTWREGL